VPASSTDQQEKMLYSRRAARSSRPMAYLRTSRPPIDREAQDALSGPLTHGYGFGVDVPSIGRSRPTTTRHSVRASPADRACCSGRVRNAGERPIRSRLRHRPARSRRFAQPAIAQRGGVETKGQFALNDKWVWAGRRALSDYTFMATPAVAYRDRWAVPDLPTEAIHLF